MKKVLVWFLALCFMLTTLMAEQRTPRPGAPNASVAEAGSSAPQAPARAQASPATQQEPAARRRSYERETGRRRRSGISKKELAFMGAIAGTSMGIGALAGGAKGLAIGSIVGGWGAYVGHRIWKSVR